MDKNNEKKSQHEIVDQNIDASSFDVENEIVKRRHVLDKNVKRLKREMDQLQKSQHDLQNELRIKKLQTHEQIKRLRDTNLKKTQLQAIAIKKSAKLFKEEKKQFKWEIKLEKNKILQKHDTDKAEARNQVKIWEQEHNNLVNDLKTKIIKLKSDNKTKLIKLEKELHTKMLNINNLKNAHDKLIQKSREDLKRMKVRGIAYKNVLTQEYRLAKAVGRKSLEKVKAEIQGEILVEKNKYQKEINAIEKIAARDDIIDKHAELERRTQQLNIDKKFNLKVKDAKKATEKHVYDNAKEVEVAKQALNQMPIKDIVQEIQQDEQVVVEHRKIAAAQEVEGGNAIEQPSKKSYKVFERANVSILGFDIDKLKLDSQRIAAIKEFRKKKKLNQLVPIEEFLPYVELISDEKINKDKYLPLLVSCIYQLIRGGTLTFLGGYIYVKKIGGNRTITFSRHMHGSLNKVFSLPKKNVVAKVEEVIIKNLDQGSWIKVTENIAIYKEDDDDHAIKIVADVGFLRSKSG